MESADLATANMAVSTSLFPTSTPERNNLLRLPRELRDMIYAYSLTYPKNEICFFRTQRHKAYFCESEEYDRVIRGERASQRYWNQLQFVNWRIRHETFGLELKLNTLVFGSDIIENGSTNGYMVQLASLQFLDFLEFCSAIWQQTIKTVRLDGAHFCPLIVLNRDHRAVYHLHRVVYWCQQQPQTTVYLPLFINRPHGPKIPQSFLISGIMLQLALRWSTRADNKAISSLIDELGLFYISAYIQRFRKLWRPDLSEAERSSIELEVQIEAANFRFLPEGGMFDEEAFRKDIRNAKGLRFVPEVSKVRTVEEVIEKWVDLAREWYARGL